MKSKIYTLEDLLRAINVLEEDANVRVRYDTAGFADLRTHPTTVKAYIKQCVHDKKVKHK